MNETHFFIKIYLSFYSWKEPTVVSLKDRWRDIYLPHIFFLRPVGANTRTPLQAVSSETLMPLLGCMFLAQLSILCTLSKSDRVVITWSPSGNTPVRPDCPDTLSSSGLLGTTWQPVKAHGVTRNEPKIHVICYITSVLGFTLNAV